MPKLHVFACPSCGGSLSVEAGSATTRCQFCGNTVLVPEEFRGQPSSAAAGGVAQGTPLKELGSLVRAGNKIAAIKLYRDLFGGGLAEAQSAVEKLAAGQGVQVTYLGMPTTLIVDRTPPSGGPSLVGSSVPVQTVQPVIITGNPGRGLGCILWAVFLTTGLGLLLTLLVTTGAMLPFLAVFNTGELPFGLGGLATGEPLGAPTAASATREPATATAAPTPSFASAVLSFGGEGAGAGTFDDPRHIAVDGDGNIYVGEWQAHRVQVFDPQGEFITQYSVGENDAILVAMDVDRAGTLFAVAGGRLYRHTGTTGELLGQIQYGGASHFDDLVVTAEGGLVTSWSSAASDNIVRFDRDYTVDLEIPEAVSSVTGDAELNMQLAVDGGGAIYVLGTFNNAVFHYSPAGQYQNRFGGDGDMPGLFRAPSTLVVDRRSRVYVSDFKGIQVFDSTGRYLNMFDVPDGGFVHGLAVDDDNFLYAVSNNSMVYKFAINE